MGRDISFDANCVGAPPNKCRIGASHNSSFIPDVDLIDLMFGNPIECSQSISQWSHHSINLHLILGGLEVSVWRYCSTQLIKLAVLVGTGPIHDMKQLTI